MVQHGTQLVDNFPADDRESKRWSLIPNNVNAKDKEREIKYAPWHRRLAAKEGISVEEAQLNQKIASQSLWNKVFAPHPPLVARLAKD